MLIVEDEKPALDRLINMINSVDQEIEIAGTCGSVKETVKWLNQNNLPDLLILDIQLSDGSSLEIFKKVDINIPVIFATAYDQHILEAFNFNAIDYLLKPIKKDKLTSALYRYKELKSHFSKDIYTLLEDISKLKQKFKERYLIKSGSSYQSVLVDDIALFYTEHKVTFLINKSGDKFIVDSPLSKIEEEINPDKFFRLNRQFIVNINSVGKFKSVNRGKLSIELTLPIKEKLIVSQEKAADFKEWLNK